MPPPNILDEKGECGHCHKDAQAESMQCWLCEDRYHVIECTGMEPLSQPSFLKNHWPGLQRNWVNITFTCPSCKEDAKTKKEVVMSSRIRLLEESSLETNKQLNAIMGLLTKDSAKVPVTPKKVKETPQVIVVEQPEHPEENSDEDNQAKWSEVTKKAIQSKVSVLNSWKNPEGKMVFTCKDEKSKKALLPHVQQVYHNRNIKTPKPRVPTISVPFIHGKYEKDELLDVLCQQNEEHGIKFTKDNSQIVFIAPMKDKDNLYQAVIRVSDEIRSKIQNQGNRLCIGINSCPVFDRFFIKRCNRCQGLGHFHKDDGGCKKNQVCALCTGNHDTRSCHTDEEYHQCTNCIKADKDNVSHAANSSDCPMYIAEQEKLKKSIHYYSSKNL